MPHTVKSENVNREMETGLATLYDFQKQGKKKKKGLRFGKEEWFPGEQVDTFLNLSSKMIHTTFSEIQIPKYPF